MHVPCSRANNDSVDNGNPRFFVFKRFPFLCVAYTTCYVLLRTPRIISHSTLYDVDWSVSYGERSHGTGIVV